MTLPLRKQADLTRLVAILRPARAGSTSLAAMSWRIASENVGLGFGCFAYSPIFSAPSKRGLREADETTLSGRSRAAAFLCFHGL